MPSYRSVRRASPSPYRGSPAYLTHYRPRRSVSPRRSPYYYNRYRHRYPSSPRRSAGYYVTGPDDVECRVDPATAQAYCFSRSALAALGKPFPAVGPARKPVTPQPEMDMTELVQLMQAMIPQEPELELEQEPEVVYQLPRPQQQVVYPQMQKPQQQVLYPQQMQKPQQQVLYPQQMQKPQQQVVYRPEVPHHQQQQQQQQQQPRPKRSKKGKRRTPSPQTPTPSPKPSRSRKASSPTYEEFNDSDY